MLAVYRTTNGYIVLLGFEPVIMDRLSSTPTQPALKKRPREQEQEISPEGSRKRHKQSADGHDNHNTSASVHSIRPDPLSQASATSHKLQSPSSKDAAAATTMSESQIATCQVSSDAPPDFDPFDLGMCFAAMAK